jgi:hypothetical protein
MQFRGSRLGTPIQSAMFVFQLLRRLLAVSLGAVTRARNNRKGADGPQSTIYPLF